MNAKLVEKPLTYTSIGIYYPFTTKYIGRKQKIKKKIMFYSKLCIFDFLYKLCMVIEVHLDLIMLYVYLSTYVSLHLCKLYNLTLSD